MEDAQLATGFVGQLGNVVFPGKIMSDIEIQKLELIVLQNAQKQKLVEY